MLAARWLNAHATIVHRARQGHGTDNGRHREKAMNLGAIDRTGGSWVQTDALLADPVVDDAAQPPAAAPAAAAPLAGSRTADQIFGPMPLSAQIQIAKAIPPGKPGAPAASPAPTAPGAPAASKPPPPPSGVQPGPVKDPPVGSVFVGLKLGAQKNETLTLPGTKTKLDLQGWGPGLGVYFPGPKTLFVSSTGSVPLPVVGKAMGSLGQLKYVATYNVPSNAWQVGVGVTEVHKGWGYFYNLRATSADILNARVDSLRQPGKDIVVGTGNAGVIQSPRCDSTPHPEIANLRLGSVPGTGSRVATGVGFQAQFVARDGDLFVKFGKQGLIPVAAWEAGLAAASQFMSNRDGITCNTGTLVQQAQSAARAIGDRVSSMLPPQQLAEYGAAAAGVAAFVLRNLAGMVIPSPSNP